MLSHTIFNQIENARFGCNYVVLLLFKTYLYRNKALVGQTMAWKSTWTLIPAYSGFFQPIPAYYSMFQPIPVYVSLFQPIPAYSSLFQAV